MADNDETLDAWEFLPPGDEAMDGFTTYPSSGFIYRLSRAQYDESQVHARWAEMEAAGVQFYGHMFWDARYWCRWALEPEKRAAEDKRREEALNGLG